MLKATLEMMIGSVMFVGALEHWEWSWLFFGLVIVGPIMFLGGAARALILFAAQFGETANR